MNTKAICSALLSIVGVALALNSGAALAQTTYRLTKLTLGGSYSAATAINASGQVTGQASTAAGEYHAFLWNGTTMQDLGTLGGTRSGGADINASGQVTGSATTAAGASRAFLWNGTAMQDLGTLGGTSSSAAALNDSGWVIGDSTTASGASHVFLWNGSSMQDLSVFNCGNVLVTDINASGSVLAMNCAGGDRGLGPALWDGTTWQVLGKLGAYTVGKLLNDAGQVAGYFSPTGSSTTTRPFLWDGTTLVDLGSLGGNGETEAYGINASGQVTGQTVTAAGQGRAFLWSGTTMQDLGTLGGAWSYGLAINDAGHVVGIAVTADGAEHPFLWDGTTMQDLNALIDPVDPLKPYVTLVAGSYEPLINSRGQVVADGVDSRTGEQHAYLISAVVAGPDADGDGINDSIDTNAGAASGGFNDGEGTSGSITARAGLTVTIEDAASPDGVRVVVGAGSGQVTLDACGFTVTVAAASELIVTCGSVTVNVIQGAAQVVLEGRMTVISIPAGVTATTTDNGDGTFLVQNVAGVGAVSVSVDGGAPTTIAPGGSQSYTVVYPFAGFFSPVDNTPTLNGAKAGSAIPVKFSLGGDQGLAIFAAGYPRSQKVYCDSSAPVDAIEETVTAGSSSLSYAGGQYHYVWKTDKAWFGTCRQLIVKLNDATVHVANFKFK